MGLGSEYFMTNFSSLQMTELYMTTDNLFFYTHTFKYVEK